jgi:4-amino-4-deoxy-L-arabinose transferase-like glycosyltransferase
MAVRFAIDPSTGKQAWVKHMSRKKTRVKRQAPSPEPAPDPAVQVVVFEEKKWLEFLLVAAALMLFMVVSIFSARQKSSTFDEGTHIPAAYTYAALGDFRMNPEHPPLVKLLAGLPLRFTQPKMDANDPDWKNANQWEFGLKFLYEWNDADKLIFRARVPIMALALLLGLTVWHWTRSLFGWKAGVFALSLCLFNPDVLAHGQLVTTDLAVACFMFIAVYLFHRALNRLTLINGLLAGLAIGLALASKFSGVLVLPMLALIGAAFAYSGSPLNVSLPKIGARTITSRNGKLAAAGGVILGAGIIALVVVWACYGFSYQISSDPSISDKIDWDHYWAKETVSTTLIRVLHFLRLVPEGYSYGFLYALESVEKRFAYLLGEFSINGWWFYFIVTFLIKTPVPLLVFIGMGFYFFKRYGAGWAAESVLLIPVALYLIVTLGSSINIGHRHLLPVYPFLIVFASKIARVFDAQGARRLKAAAGLLMVWYVAGMLITYPHYLSYFNEIAGGPSNGYRWLADSSIDWGQDLKELAKYRAAHPDEPFYLSYFGSAYPEYYGVKAQTLPGFNSQMAEKMRKKELARFDEVQSGATVAISVTNLSGVYLRNYRLPGTDQFLERLRHLQPVARLGNSIFVYRIP